MDKTPPPSERARIRRLREYAILDTLPEVDFDNITRIASAICQTPIALISLVDVDRQWFKSAIGLTERETPLEASFCAHAIQDPSHVLTVTDATLDSRFSETPLVTGSLGIRFYSGVPLVDAEGYALGTLCIIDQKPRQALTEEQEESLKALASQVMRLLELRLRNREIQAVSERLMEKNDELHQFALTLSHDIKSPLAGIQQLAELIQENMPKEANPKVQTSIDMIRTTGLRLQEMIIAVLEYYRLGDHSDSEAEEIEIEAFLKDNAALALDSLHGKYEVSADVERVTHKKAVLQLVLLNLIENAYRHNYNEDLLIRISAKRMDNLVRIAVEDNGQGVNPEMLSKTNRLFKSPTNIDRFGRRSYGMGLAKVRKLLETEGSELHLESPIGQGSVFYFDIPA